MFDFLKDDNFLQLTCHVNSFSRQKLTSSVFAELMQNFYDLGWMRGSGGAMGCLQEELLFISPSALQKERIISDDLLIYDVEKKTAVQLPKDTQPSSCAPLFSLIMNATGCSTVIHTHSSSANLITQLLGNSCFYEISHQEYLKGVWNPFTGKTLANTDTLSIPIIDNKPSEIELINDLSSILSEPICSCAVLVRNHGLFVWGPTWEQTKITTECIEYLLELSIQMKRFGISLVKTENNDDKCHQQPNYQSTFLT
ncbi:unnamed protein product [Auanema sp. JU1783]|nr:unnamed protein product [Auanema sp. JU1783]